MSSSTTYINFSSIDYKGVDSLSSYATSLTPLKFVADLPNTYNNRLIWDFGDGSISRIFSPSKTFEFPGRYTVRLVVYDCNNNAMVSSIEKIIIIEDYINYTFNIKPEIESNDLQLKVGKINGPFTADAFYPPYQTASSIFYNISGSTSSNYWDIKDNKFSHLDNFHTLYSKIYNYGIKSYQFIEIDKIQFQPIEMYAKIENGSIINCESTDIGASIIGLSASQEFYIKDDSVSDLMLVDFWFDKTNNQNSEKYNNLGVTLSCSVISNSAYRISVTSNGLDGEGYPIESFNINPIKFFNTNIPFVVKLKDIENFTVKNFNPIELSAINIIITAITDTQLASEGGQYLLDEYGNSIYATGVSITLDSSNYSISSLNYTLDSQSHGGSFRGYITFPYTDMDVLQNAQIAISGAFTNDQFETFTLSGASNVFNVYNNNYFDIWKINEDFNPENTLKDLRFQETLLDKSVLFEDFLGGVLGNENSDHDAIGVKIYEKIANFIQNTQDVDNCEQEYIESIAQFVGYNNVNDERYIYPENIKRLINLTSIDKNKLIGESNKFRENFDVRGRTSKTEYGINIGNQIDINTYIVNKNIPIVALEKFSNQYTLLNTYQPLSSDLLPDTYPLSGYNSSWGWPLVLPNSFIFEDFEKYYLFFEYNDQYDNTLIGGSIDFNNEKTTIPENSSYNDLISPNGIFEHMFLDTLYQSLSLM